MSFWFITRQGLIQYIKLAVITQQNVLHCIVQYVIQLHVSALFLGHHQNSIILSSWYIILKAKQIQPDDGLEKGPKHVVVKHIVQYSAINFIVL